MIKLTQPNGNGSDHRLRKYTPSPFIVKPYSTCELSRIYTVSPKTFLKWLKPFKKKIGKRNGNYFTVLQVEIIIEKLGAPYCFD